MGRELWGRERERERECVLRHTWLLTSKLIAKSRNDLLCGADLLCDVAFNYSRWKGTLISAYCADQQFLYN